MPVAPHLEGKLAKVQQKLEKRLKTVVRLPSFNDVQRDPVLYYVQRLRDEAHRFAIGSHRARRAKAIAANPRMDDAKSALAKLSL